jgi:hypothetical protein
MAWRIVDQSTTALTVRRGTTEFPDRLWVQEIGNSYPCFLWVADKSAAGFPSFDSAYDPANTTAQYIKIKDSDLGIHHSEGDWGIAHSPDYLYFAADFTNAQNAVYTSNLVIELFQE